MSLLACGSIHPGHERFCGQSRGKQCSFMRSAPLLKAVLLYWGGGGGAGRGAIELCPFPLVFNTKHGHGFDHGFDLYAVYIFIYSISK